jgi:uncharacterized protein (TIGR03435 family)
MSKSLLTNGGTFVLLPALLFPAQIPTDLTKPRFEVVSVHRVRPDAPPISRDANSTSVLPGGRYSNPRTNLISMISFAYQVQNSSMALSGLPNWAREETYSVTATSGSGFPTLTNDENRERVRVMFQALLEERFHLQLHTEIRQEKVFSLEVAKGGPKMSKVNASEPPDIAHPVAAAVGNGGGRIIGNTSTMSGLAASLVIFLKRPVIDNTGLSGYYNFDIKWVASGESQPPSGPLGPEGISMLISNVETELGLHLRTTDGPVKYWIVDHLEPPTDN